MEEICQRFPLIAQKILNHVDNETLINFKEAGRNNDAFLEKERFYWIRIIQRYNCLIGELQEVWKRVVNKTPVEIIKELAVAFHQFPQILKRTLHKNGGAWNYHICNETECNCTLSSPLDFVQNFEKQWHPLFIGATSGSTNLCNHIIEKAGDVRDPRLLNPAHGLAKITPIVFVADLIEDVNVLEFLHEKADDKNPTLLSDTNWTLLHSLAAKGHFKMCTSIIKKIKDLSPRDIRGYTPYHIAAMNGQVKVCHLLMDYLTDHNPKANCGRTPLHLAASYGHLEVCILLMKSFLSIHALADFKSAKAYMDKNQMNGVLRIPLHMAAFNGHVEVVRHFMANLVDNEGQKLSIIDFNRADLLLVNNKIPVEYRQTRKLHPTPLLNAIQGGSLNVCELLIEGYKVDVIISDEFGMTPLHLASKLGHLEICKLLSKYVLDKNTLDSDGKTPHDLAISEHKWNIVSFLNKWSLIRFA